MPPGSTPLIYDWYDNNLRSDWLRPPRSQLFTTLMVQQVVNQVQEVLVPFFLQKPASQRFIHKMTKKLGIHEAPVAR